MKLFGPCCSAGLALVVLGVLAGCGQQDPEGGVPADLVIATAPPGAADYPMAQIKGRLGAETVAEGTCLFIEAEPGDRYGLLFPAGTSAGGSPVRITFDEGTSVTVGETVTLGGGELGDVPLPQLWAGCQGIDEGWLVAPPG